MRGSWFLLFILHFNIHFVILFISFCVVGQFCFAWCGVASLASCFKTTAGNGAMSIFGQNSSPDRPNFYLFHVIRNIVVFIHFRRHGSSSRFRFGDESRFRFVNIVFGFVFIAPRRWRLRNQNQIN